MIGQERKKEEEEGEIAWKKNKKKIVKTDVTRRAAQEKELGLQAGPGPHPLARLFRGIQIQPPNLMVVLLTLTQPSLYNGGGGDSCPGQGCWCVYFELPGRYKISSAVTEWPICWRSVRPPCIKQQTKTRIETEEKTEKKQSEGLTSRFISPCQLLEAVGYKLRYESCVARS